MDYDEKQFNKDSNRIPLANTANWEELCESYTEEQIRLMLEVISTNRKLMLNFSDRMIQEE
jgi:hypothetical protein